MDFLELGPSPARATLLLGHGAGAPMDGPGMTAVAEALARAELRVVRFEFAYMGTRRTTGSRKPPPKAEKLIDEFHAAIDAFNPDLPLFIGGKSMGGRVASMLADDLFAVERIAGLLCIGYPFHPIGKPDKRRTAHLESLATPTLICLGTRDPFGNQNEVAEYTLAPSIDLRWFEDGDHDLKPRKRISGFTQADHMASMAASVSDWIDGLSAD